MLPTTIRIWTGVKLVITPVVLKAFTVLWHMKFLMAIKERHMLHKAKTPCRVLDGTYAYEWTSYSPEPWVYPTVICVRPLILRLFPVGAAIYARMRYLYEKEPSN